VAAAAVELTNEELELPVTIVVEVVDIAAVEGACCCVCGEMVVDIVVPVLVTAPTATPDPATVVSFQPAAICLNQG